MLCAEFRRNRTVQILVAQICGERKEGAMMIMHYVYDVLADAV